jgi:hypothetical protein
MLHHMLLICKHFKAYEDDALLKPVVTHYIKYWKDIPMLYSFAFILDPRGKLKGFSKVLKLLGNFLSVDYSSYLTEVRAQLNIIYKMYDGKFGAAKKKTCLQPPSTGKKNTAWDDIFADDDDDNDIFATPGSGNSFWTPTLSLCKRTSASASAGSSMGVGNELSNYLDSDTLTQFDDRWWHEHLSFQSLLEMFWLCMFPPYLQNMFLVLLAGSLRSGGDN